jgi:hypothetical protein
VRRKNVVSCQAVLCRATCAVEGADLEAARRASLNRHQDGVGCGYKRSAIVNKIARVVEVDAGGPLERIQALRGRSVT